MSVPVPRSASCTQAKLKRDQSLRENGLQLRGGSSHGAVQLKETPPGPTTKTVKPGGYWRLLLVAKGAGAKGG